MLCIIIAKSKTLNASHSILDTQRAYIIIVEHILIWYTQVYLSIYDI